MIKSFQQIISKLLATRHYKNDQSGIINRYLAEGINWSNHLNNSKEYILSALPTDAEKIAILGSGWLLDVPLDEILKTGTTVHLYDIVHPHQIKNKFNNVVNVEFVTTDLNNGIVEIVKQSKSFEKFREKLIAIRPFKGLDQYDYVVSVNLLNQLDILLCDLLKKKFKVNNSDLIEIRKRIQQFHVNSLPKNKSCIITDYAEKNYTKSNLESKTNKLIYVDLEFLKNKVFWDWDFDTHQTYRSNFNTMFNVLAGEL